MPQMNNADLARISSKDQTLVIHCGKVYDVTKFVNVHPGGGKILSLRHGKDVTKIMETGPHTHSKNAYRWLRQYYIADYCDGEDSPNINHTTSNGHVPSKPLTNGVHNKTENDAIGDQEDIVDWNKPMLWQVGHLGAKYHDWIDDPVDKNLRLFKSDFVEFFSNTPWYIIPIVWLPVIVCFLLRSFSFFSDSSVALFPLAPVASPFSVTSSAMPVIFVLGMLLWSFLEYSLHRWLFHSDPPTTSYFLVTLHFLLHGQHHKVPFDSGRLVFPPVASSVFLAILYPIFRFVLSAAVTDCLVAGVLFGYVCYDMTHYYLHYGAPRKGSYFDRLRAYHVRHHFESPHLGFGISSKLWDYPFNTLIKMTSRRSK